MIVQLDSFPLCFYLQSDRIPIDETKLESESLAWRARQESCGTHSEINRESIGTMISPLTVIGCLVYRLLISDIKALPTPTWARRSGVWLRAVGLSISCSLTRETATTSQRPLPKQGLFTLPSHDWSASEHYPANENHRKPLRRIRKNKNLQSRRMIPQRVIVM